MRGLLGHLFQTYPQLLLKSIREKHRRLGDSLFNGFYHLWQLLMEVVTLQDDRHIFCIIDAIDECPRESQSMLYRQIQEIFRQSSSQIRLSVLLLSRPYPEIRHQLGNFLDLDLASYPQLGQAIQKYIHHAIQKLSEAKNYPSSTKEELINILELQAEGTFLWVGFAYQDLQTLSSWNAVKHLKRLPKGLDSLYTNLFESLLKSSEEDMNSYQRILGFIAAAKRPMTLLELSEACQLDTEEDEKTRVQFMRERIGDLQFFAVISRTHLCEAATEQVTLLHQTAREFIYNRLDARYGKNEQKLHADLSYRCLDEIIWHLPESSKSAQSSGHLLEYACDYWPYHARMAQKEFTLQSSHVKFFTANSSVLQAWWGYIGASEAEIQSQYSAGSADVPPLTIAAVYGLWTIIDDLFAMQQYESPLFRAVYADGYTDYIFLSLPNEWCSPIKSPLTDAIYSDSFETFSCLLKLGLPLTKLTLEHLENLEDNAGFIDLIVSERKEELMQNKYLHVSIVTAFNAKALQVFLAEPRLELSDIVVKWAFTNPRMTSQILDMFVDRFGLNEVFSTANFEFAIFLGLLEGVASFFQLGRRIISVTNAHIRAAIDSCRSEGEKATLLVMHRGDLCINEDTLLYALGCLFTDVKFWNAVFAIESSKIQLTERVILEGLGVPDPDTEEAWMLNLLLDTRRPELQINEDLIKAVIRNEKACLHGIKLLFSHRGSDVGIAQEILAVAAAEVDVDTFLAIWDSSGKVNFDTKVIVATTKNMNHGSDIMELAISHAQIPFQIDESIIRATFVEKNCKLMALIVKKRGVVGLFKLYDCMRSQIPEEIITLPGEKFSKVMKSLFKAQADVVEKYPLGGTPNDARLMEICQMMLDWNYSEEEEEQEEEEKEAGGEEEDV
jgi:hypothetical protein